MTNGTEAGKHDTWWTEVVDTNPDEKEVGRFFLRWFSWNRAFSGARSTSLMVRATYSPPHRNKRQIGSQRSILTNFWKFWNLSWGSDHITYCSTFAYLAKNLGNFWTYKKVLRISKTLSAWERGCAVISIYSSCAISDLNKNEKNLQFFFYQSDILGFSSTHRKQRFCKTKYI